MNNNLILKVERVYRVINELLDGISVVYMNQLYKYKYKWEYLYLYSIFFYINTSILPKAVYTIGNNCLTRCSQLTQVYTCYSLYLYI